MRVVLVSPPHSPVLQPLNGALKQEPVYEAPDLKETPVSTNQEMNGVENLHPFHVRDLVPATYRFLCFTRTTW